MRLLMVTLTVDLDDVDADHGRLDPIGLGYWSVGVVGFVRGAGLHATRVIFSFFRANCLLRVLVGLVSEVDPDVGVKRGLAALARLIYYEISALFGLVRGVFLQTLSAHAVNF